MTNYELIYSHPELMIDWFPILGNHEYRGNTQAVLDYTNVSRRWSMPGRYYTKVFEKKGTAIRFVMIDTAPLIDKYRNESETGVQNAGFHVEGIKHGRIAGLPQRGNVVYIYT